MKLAALVFALMAGVAYSAPVEKRFLFDTLVGLVDTAAHVIVDPIDALLHGFDTAVAGHTDGN